MKKRTRKNFINLAICLLIALLGILINIASAKLFDFRLCGGWSFVQGSETKIGLLAMAIMIFEFGSAFVGLFLTFLGGIGAYNNAKKMR